MSTPFVGLRLSLSLIALATGVFTSPAVCAPQSVPGPTKTGMPHGPLPLRDPNMRGHDAAGVEYRAGFGYLGRPIPVLPRVDDLQRCAQFVGLDPEVEAIADSLKSSAAEIRRSEIEKRAVVFDADTRALESEPAALDPGIPPTDAEVRAHLEMILRAADVAPSLIERSRNSIREALLAAANAVEPPVQLEEARVERAAAWWGRKAMRRLLKTSSPGSCPASLMEDLEDAQLFLSPEVWADVGAGEQSLLNYEREAAEELRECWRALREYWNARLRNGGETTFSDGVPLRSRVAAATVRLWDFEVRSATQIELGRTDWTREVRMIRTSRLLPAVAPFASAENRLLSLGDPGSSISRRASDIAAQLAAAQREFYSIARDRVLSWTKSVVGGTDQADQNERYRVRMRQVRDRLGSAIAAELMAPESRTSSDGAPLAAEGRDALEEALKPLGRLREDGTWAWENMHKDWPRGLVDTAQ